MKAIKIIGTLILLMNVCLLSAQKKELYVGYKYEANDHIKYKPLVLRANHTQSLSKITQVVIPDGQEGKLPPALLKQLKYEITHVYMDYNKNSMESEELLTFGLGQAERMCVKENLNEFKWQITGNKEEILGYQCQEATTSFKGRDYLAWFTNDVPFKAGPWKFNGLPGVILKVQSVDEYLKIEATLLKIQEAKEIISPIDNSEVLTWKKFEEYYKKSVKSSEARMRSLLSKLPGDAPQLPKEVGYPRIEIIIEANRLTSATPPVRFKFVEGNEMSIEF